jgi:ATP-dependent 26S proteasome regulatory subunit
MNDYFKVKKITDIKNINNSAQLPESDFSLFTSDDKFVQFELVKDAENLSTIAVKPGIYAVSETKNEKMGLVVSGFTEQTLLEDYASTKDISNKIHTFFNKLDVYKKFGIDPKRAMLLYGPPGTGKSLLLSKIANEYAALGETSVIIWPTDKYSARDVKSLFKRLDYKTNDIKRLILIVEDLGGTEQNSEVMQSESSLLSLLDNVEKTFTIPTMILATTNFPENFLENLTNRPQRFDDLIEVKRPQGEQRAKFLEFFSLGEASESALTKIKHKKYDELFSVAHVKEVVIRSALYDISLESAMDQLEAQAEKAKKQFTNRRKIGMDFMDE